ncbi:MAG: gamma-glutamyltransferase [Candidatus Cybelea sp.]|jgi:gamma-glutamyltranspeptidase/glutathione hydrolase
MFRARRALCVLFTFALACSQFAPAAVALPSPASTMHATTAQGASFAIATDHYLASQTGARVLRDGGTAVDAAIAIAYALAVTFPVAGNIGGGGFMLIHLKDGSSHFIDFRETAPAAAYADMYLDARGRPDANRSTIGPLSAGVPGTVAGLEYAREHFGTLSRATLIAPAIAYARGFRIDEADAQLFADERNWLAQFPSTKAVFLRDGKPLREGQILRQPDLEQTLRAISERGVDGFYRGPVARALVASAKGSGGVITLADLAGYRAVARTPLTCARGADTIVTSPPPSSGGVAICEILGIVGPVGPAGGGALRDAANAHLEIEAERRAFADRNTALGDPDFVHAPVAQLLNPAYLARQRASITPTAATPSSEIPGFGVHEGHNTTNFSVVDAAGNAVDVTYTLNNGFGSGFVAAGTGVLLNDEMDDFTSKPGAPNMFGLVQGTANAIAPGKRPLSSMMPTIVLDANGNPVLIAGAEGGPRIITAVLDIVRDVIDFHESISEAVAQARVHMQWLPDLVYAEPGAFAPEVLAKLRTMGYRFKFEGAGSGANAIAVASDGTRTAAHDPRTPTGSAIAR